MNNILTKSYGNCNVLVVDDQEMNQMLMGAILEQCYDINAHFANNGQEAVELVDDKFYDLIFMDINMPIMDGIEATRLIKRQYPNMPIVAFTTNRLDENREEFLAAGMTGYLSKPIDRSALKKVIQKHLDTNLC